MFRSSHPVQLMGLILDLSKYEKRGSSPTGCQNKVVMFLQLRRGFRGLQYGAQVYPNLLLKILIVLEIVNKL